VVSRGQSITSAEISDPIPGAGISCVAPTCWSVLRRCPRVYLCSSVYKFQSMPRYCREEYRGPSSEFAGHAEELGLATVDRQPADL
jgi:hypothetical protein